MLLIVIENSNFCCTFTVESKDLLETLSYVTLISMIQRSAVQVIFQLKESLPKHGLCEISKFECFLNFLHEPFPPRTKFNILNSIRIQKC